MQSQMLITIKLKAMDRLKKCFDKKTPSQIKRYKLGLKNRWNESHENWLDDRGIWVIKSDRWYYEIGRNGGLESNRPTEEYLKEVKNK